MAGGGDGGGPTAEMLMLRGQKSTNQLRALLANLLPAVAEADGSAVEVEALLSEISDSLSQALASLRIGGAAYDQHRPAPRKIGQRMRVDSACRTIRLQHGDYDPYTWRKYGQKQILGAKFARHYFKCAHKSDLSCSAKKQVQQSDGDPSVLEITYIGAHTCDRPSASDSVPYPVASGTHRSGDRLPPVAVDAVATTPQTPAVHHVPDHVPTDMAWTPPWMEQEQASLLFIPSPACSQSELLPAVEVPELIVPDDSPVLMELKLSGRHTIVSDSVVPEL